MAVEHLVKYLEGEIARYRKIRDEFFKAKKINFLHEAKQEVVIPEEIFSANIYIDAYTKAINFLNYTPPSVDVGMSNEASFKVACELFLGEVLNDGVEWNHHPDSNDREIFEKEVISSIPEDPVGTFNSLLYYWFYFKRNEQPYPDAA